MGSGGGTLSPGVLSLLMCQVHSCSSSATFSQSFIFPSLLRRGLVVYSLVELFLVVMLSVISSGRRVCRDLTIDFLLVVSMPP